MKRFIFYFFLLSCTSVLAEPAETKSPYHEKREELVALYRNDGSAFETEVKKLFNEENKKTPTSVCLHHLLSFIQSLPLESEDFSAQKVNRPTKPYRYLIDFAVGKMENLEELSPYFEIADIVRTIKTKINPDAKQVYIYPSRFSTYSPEYLEAIEKLAQESRFQSELRNLVIGILMDVFSELRYSIPVLLKTKSEEDIQNMINEFAERAELTPFETEAFRNVQNQASFAFENSVYRLAKLTAEEWRNLYRDLAQKYGTPVPVPWVKKKTPAADAGNKAHEPQKNETPDASTAKGN